MVYPGCKEGVGTFVQNFQNVVFLVGVLCENGVISAKREGHMSPAKSATVSTPEMFSFAWRVLTPRKQP